MANPIGMLKGRATLPVLMLIYAAAFLDRQILSLLVGSIRQSLHVSDTSVSFVQGFAFVIAFTVFAIPFGAAVDRFSRRNIILFAALSWSLFAFLSGLADSYNELLAARIGIGAAEAALAPAVYSLLADSVPPSQMSRTLAIFSTGAIVGGGVSLAGSAYVADRVTACAGCISAMHGLAPWQIVIIVMAVPGLVFGLAALLIAEPARRHDPVGTTQGSFAETLRLIFPHRGFYLSHFFGFALLNVLVSGWNAWAPSYLVRSHGWTITRAGLTLGSTALIGGVIGMLASGQIADRLYRRGTTDAHLRLYVWATPLLGIAGIVAAIASTEIVLIPAMLAISLISPFIAVAAAALQITSPSRMRGKISALFLAVYNMLGFGLGPTVVAFISDAILGDEHKLWLALAICFGVFAPLASVVFAFGLRPMRATLEAGSPECT